MIVFVSDSVKYLSFLEILCLYFRDKVLVCPMKSAPVLLTLSDSKHVVLPVDDDSDLNVVAAFDRRGEYIYTGNAKGKVSNSDRQLHMKNVTCLSIYIRMFEVATK